MPPVLSGSAATLTPVRRTVLDAAPLGERFVRYRSGASSRPSATACVSRRLPLSHNRTSCSRRAVSSTPWLAAPAAARRTRRRSRRSSRWITASTPLSPSRTWGRSCQRVVRTSSGNRSGRRWCRAAVTCLSVPISRSSAPDGAGFGEHGELVVRKFARSAVRRRGRRRPRTADGRRPDGSSSPPRRPGRAGRAGPRRRGCRPRRAARRRAGGRRTARSRRRGAAPSGRSGRSGRGSTAAAVRGRTRGRRPARCPAGSDRGRRWAGPGRRSPPHPPHRPLGVVAPQRARPRTVRPLGCAPWTSSPSDPCRRRAAPVR